MHERTKDYENRFRTSNQVDMNFLERAAANQNRRKSSKRKKKVVPASEWKLDLGSISFLQTRTYKKYTQIPAINTKIRRIEDSLYHYNVSNFIDNLKSITDKTLEVHSLQEDIIKTRKLYKDNIVTFIFDNTMNFASDKDSIFTEDFKFNFRMVVDIENERHILVKILMNTKNNIESVYVNEDFFNIENRL